MNVYMIYLLVLIFINKVWQIHTYNSDCLDKSEQNVTSVEVGSDATVLCQVSLDKQIETENHILVWKIKYWNTSDNWLEIQEDENIKIRDVNMTEGDQLVLSELHLKNASVENEGIYGCFVNDTVLLDEEPLFIGYPPSKPTNLNCITNGDLKFMDCCWEMTNTYCPTEYLLSYYIQGSESTTLSLCCEYNDVTEQTCCIVDTENTYFLLYNMTLFVENGLGKSTSEPTAINPSYHYKPFPPTNVMSAPKVVDEINNCLDITWMRPSEGTGACFMYLVETREETSDTWNILRNTTLLALEICDLNSTSLYHSQVKAYAAPSSVAPASNCLLQGEWSDPSEIANATTLLTIPSSDFTFKDVVILISSPGVSNDCLHFTWYPYLYQQEEEFRYEVSYGNCISEIRTNVTGETELTDYLETENVCLSGTFCNKAGCSATSFYNTSTKQALPPPHNVNVNMLSGFLEISWDLQEVVPLESKCNIRLCSSTRYEEDVSKDHVLGEDYCTYSTFSKELLNHINCWDKSTKISVSNACKVYYVIVEIVQEDFVVQSTESQFVTFDPIISSPDYFTAEDNSTLTDFKIFVEWGQISNCQGSVIAIEYYEKTNKDNVFIQEFPNCNNTSGIIYYEVYGDISYTLTMKTMCSGDSTTKQTENSILFDLDNTTTAVTTSIGVPMAPSNVRISELYEINPILQWLAPEHTNGQNTKYLVQYGYEDVFKDEESSETELAVYIPCPQPGDNSTTYLFHVQAFNVLENGTAVYSDSSDLDNVSCVLVEGLLPLQIALIVICVTFVVILGILLFFYHRRFRNYVKNKVLSPTPTPQIKIQLSNDVIWNMRLQDTESEQLDEIETISVCSCSSKNKIHKNDRIDSGIENEAFEQEEMEQSHVINYRISNKENEHDLDKDIEYMFTKHSKEKEIHKITIGGVERCVKRRSLPHSASTVSLDSGFANRSRTTSSSSYKAYIKYVHTMNTLSSSSSHSITSECDTWSTSFTNPYNIPSLDLAVCKQHNNCSGGIVFKADMIDSEDNISDIASSSGYVTHYQFDEMRQTAKFVPKFTQEFSIGKNMVVNVGNNEESFHDEIDSFYWPVPSQAMLMNITQSEEQSNQIKNNLQCSHETMLKAEHGTKKLDESLEKISLSENEIIENVENEKKFLNTEICSISHLASLNYITQTQVESMDSRIDKQTLPNFILKSESDEENLSESYDDVESVSDSPYVFSVEQTLPENINSNSSFV